MGKGYLPHFLLEHSLKFRLVEDNTGNPNDAVSMAAVRFFLKRLLGKEEYSHVKVIDIKLNATIKNEGEAFTTSLKDGSIKVRIKIRKDMNFLKVLSALAHECIHTKQFITGELSHTEKDEWIWKGKNYGEDPYDGLTHMQVIRRLPWEKEAYSGESDLVREFVRYYTLGYFPHE